MKNRRLHPITLSTLSPIHIGCDEVFEPSNFVIHDGELHVLDPISLMSALDDNEHRQLMKLSDSPEPIGALQQFFRSRAEKLARIAGHRIAVADAIAREYADKAGRATQRDDQGKATYNLFPIARTAYRPYDNTAYLPGSSLKGSVRTAWLNRLNDGRKLTPDEGRDKENAPRHLQEKLLGYHSGNFENDPFRHVQFADAHPEDDDSPPTRILYAVSKKKRLSERGSPELRVFLETIVDALPDAFHGELRLTAQGEIGWQALCDTCNDFYWPQLEAEIDHPVLNHLLDPAWKRLIGQLLCNELGELRRQRQGFLLRVGRHSGAESLTLDGLRDIKILGKTGEKPSYRPNTTEKRFATLNKRSDGNLLPFGWVWVNGCDDAHRHLHDTLRHKLAERAAPLREAAIEKAAQAAAQKIAAEKAAEEIARLAALSQNQRRVEELKVNFRKRAEQIASKPDKPNTAWHDKARALVKAAHEETGWTPSEKIALADAIEEWLPKVIQIDLKDERKKLKLAALRGN